MHMHIHPWVKLSVRLFFIVESCCRFYTFPFARALFMWRRRYCTHLRSTHHTLHLHLLCLISSPLCAAFPSSLYVHAFSYFFFLLQLAFPRTYSFLGS